MSSPYDMIGPADHLEELVAEQAREVERLRARNAELVAALKIARRWMPAEDYGPNDASTVVDAAIAKAEQQT